MPQNLIFFGNEQLAQGIKAKTPIFDALIENGYQISALILPVKPSRKPFAIEKRANEEDIPIFYTKNTDEILEIIDNYKPAAAILASYSKIIPQSIIDAFPSGIINIHPSLLPKYRGTTPIETAILNGDHETGVSIMDLALKMDAGDIYAQKIIKIGKNTTKQNLYENLADIGAEALIKVLPYILTKSAPKKTQNDQDATYTQKLDKTLAELKFADKGASELAREVYAFAGFPKSKANLKGKNCIITASHAAKKPETLLDQLCADGNYLVIDRLIPENSKEMNAQSFLNGLKNQK